MYNAFGKNKSQTKNNPTKKNREMFLCKYKKEEISHGTKAKNKFQIKNNKK